MKIAAITSSDIANGPGVRCTIWVSGCNHKCPGCHNSELQDYNFGKYNILDPEVFDIINTELNKSYISGVTFSGGDPLDQSGRNLRELRTFITYIRQHYPNKSIWIYSGGKFEVLNKVPIINHIFQNSDVLVDGLFEIDKRDITLPFRGSSNQRIIDLKQTLEQNKIIEIDDNTFKK